MKSDLVLYLKRMHSLPFRGLHLIRHSYITIFSTKLYNLGWTWRLAATSGQKAKQICQNDDRFKMEDKSAEKKARLVTELENFDELFPRLVDDLTKQGLKEDQIACAMNWFKQVCEYNVPHGKKNRGMAVIQSYCYLKGNEVTERELHQARVIGWCIEFLQAFFLVADDLMDRSTTRRGKPCWYTRPGVGYEAVNDAFYLESAIYMLLKQHCRNENYYVDLLELFHETTLQTVTGQCLDMLAASQDKVDFTNFTVSKYNAIVKWKTAYYSFYLPVACAMHMAGISDEESHTNARTILLKMGEYFQVQDDFLDCYGDPAVMGKVGTDIEDNKCSWLIVQALTRVSPNQRLTLEANYGSCDPEKVAKVKEVYERLNLIQVYQDYEERSYTEQLALIEKLSRTLPKEMFSAFAQKIYKRQK